MDSSFEGTESSPTKKKQKKKQIVMLEKVEILDESTGQIILKERRVTKPAEENEDADTDGSDQEECCLTSGHHLPMSTEENNTGRSGGPGDDSECQIAFPHSSIISKDQVADLQPVPVNSTIDKNTTTATGGNSTTTTFYRCPLCPVKTAYYNLLASKCLDHINSNKHLGLAVRHHQWYICKCEDVGCSREQDSSSSSAASASNNGSCGSSRHVHYHCPHCARLFTKRNDLKAHLASCCLVLSLSSLDDDNGRYSSDSIVQISPSPSSPSTSSPLKLASSSSSSPVAVQQQQQLPPPQYNVLYLVNPTVSMASKPVLRCVNPSSSSSLSTPSQNSSSSGKRLVTLDSSTSSPLTPATKIIKLVHTTNELQSATSGADASLSLVDFQQLQQTLGIHSASSSTTAPSAASQSTTDDEQNHNHLLSAAHQIVNLASSNTTTSTTTTATKSPEPGPSSIHHHVAFKTHGHKAASSFSLSQHNYHSEFTAKSSSSSLYNSGLPAHIVQNYSILANEIIAPLDSPPPSSSSSHQHHHGHQYGGAKFSSADTSSTSAASIYDDIDYSSVLKQWTNAANQAVEAAAAAAAAAASKKTPMPSKRTTPATASSSTQSQSQSASPSPGQQQALKSQRDTATCQFCGRFMLKKNIPTHIRRAHTPKEELVCLNEEQCIFTLQHLKPGQRRKRSARAYDYSLMTAKVSIDDDPCDSIENKFIMFGEEILNTDLAQLADRIKYGVSQIPASTLSALVDVLGKIESSNSSNQEAVCDKAKELKTQICYFLASGEEFKYKLRQVGDEITSKKSQVNALRAELKEIMSKKAQLERRIQPLVCDLQRLEDHHGNLIESIYHVDMFDYSLATNSSSSSSNASSTSKYDDDDDEGDEEDEEEEEEEES